MNGVGERWGMDLGAAKDPNMPKRPASAFFVFIRKTFKDKHPANKSVAVVGKAGGEKWKSMSENAGLQQETGKETTLRVKKRRARSLTSQSRKNDDEDDDEEESDDEDDEESTLRVHNPHFYWKVAT